MPYKKQKLDNIGIVVTPPPRNVELYKMIQEKAKKRKMEKKLDEKYKQI